MICRCPRCNAQIQHDARLCYNCGLQFKQAPQQPVKKKDGCFIKLMKFVLLPIVMFVFFMSMLDNFSNTAQDPTTTASVQATATATPKLTATPTPKPTATPKPTEAPTSLEDIMIQIRTFASDNYDYFDVNVKDGMLVINLGTKGLMNDVEKTVRTRSQELMDAWANVKMVYISLGETIENTLRANGHTTPYMLSLVNDKNTDESLMTILNGMVIYDYVEAN